MGPIGCPETSVRIQLEFLPLEGGIERLSRNVGKGSFLFLTLKVESNGCPKTSVRILFWILDPGRWDRRLSRNVGKVSNRVFDPCKWD
jgi:hypothetical protein